MNILSYLTPERTVAGASASSKKRTFELISQLLSSGCDELSDQSVFESLFARERLGCTGLGQGVALPHGRCSSCNTMIGALVMLETPIEYESKDREPVDIIFALLVPEEAHGDHLGCLASIAKLLQHDSFRRQLRNAHSSQALYDIIASSINKQSANDD